MPEEDPAQLEYARESAALLLRTLTSIEEHWANQGFPIAERLAPGLSNEEIDALLAPAGVQLNEVNRTLFRWHNGTTPSPDPTQPPSPHGEIALGWQFRPLADLIAYYLGPWTDASRRAAADSQGFGPEGPWGRRWFPLLRNSDNRNAIATLATQGRWSSQQPIRVGGQGESPIDAPRMSSIIPLFQFLWLWLEHGYMTWDQDTQRWRYDEQIHPMTYRASWWW